MKVSSQAEEKKDIRKEVKELRGERETKEATFKGWSHTCTDGADGELLYCSSVIFVCETFLSRRGSEVFSILSSEDGST